MQDHLSHSQIAKVLAGISFFFKLHNLPPLNVFFSVKQALKGYKKITYAPDKRRPISINMLRHLCLSTRLVCHNPFEETLFQTAFCLAFFAALRVSELVPANSVVFSGLRFQDVLISGTGIRMFIRRSKTDQLGKGRWIQLNQCKDPIICPAIVVSTYLSVRPDLSGNFLIHRDGLPLTKFQFSSVFKKCLRVMGFPETQFSTHSFRIGAATEAARMGLDDAIIRRLGRWESDRFNIYIRPNLFI